MGGSLPDREAFYRELTLRNSGFISEAAQQRLRSACIVVAGCGSTGGSVVELLVRTGAEHLILADNGTYDINNANRQNMTLADVGAYKVNVFARRCGAINPFCQIETLSEGVTPSNVHTIVKTADVVIDAVDVTTRSGLLAKYELHETARKHRKAVICGYDMAASQYVAVFDYANTDAAPLRGLITKQNIETLDPMVCCALLVPSQFIPPEMFAEIDRNFRGEKSFVSQLGIAANLFGVIAAALVLDLLQGQKVNEEIYADVWAITRAHRSDVETDGRVAIERDRLMQFVQTQLAG